MDSTAKVEFKSRRLRPVVAAVLSACSGFMVALPWLDERAFSLAWVGMTLWLATTIGQPPYMAFRQWLLGAMVGLGTAFYWFPSVAAKTLNVSLWSGLVVGLLEIGWDAFRFGVFGHLAASLVNHKGLGPNSQSLWPPGGWIAGKALVWPLVWVALEWVWPHIFPWRLGHSQIGCLPLCQIADVTGVYGVSFLLLWGAASIAYALRAWWDSTESPVRWASYTQAAVCWLALAGGATWGAWRMRQIENHAAGQPHLTVALIQPGDQRADMLAALREQSLAVAGQVDLVVWPESTIADFSLELTSFRSKEDVLKQARSASPDPQPCPKLGRPLLCVGGSFTPETKDSGPFHNTAFLIDADERILGRYNKRVLLPWGEYVVGQQYLPGLTRMLAGGTGTLVPGRSARPLSLPDGTRLGVLICYEDLIERSSRDTTAEGAELLLNLNNLSAFGETSAVPGHQLLARFRAIENRRGLLRCGLVGSTAVISPAGRVEQQAPLHRPATLVARAPLLHVSALYTRWGDVFAVTCLTLAAMLVVGRRFL